MARHYLRTDQRTNTPIYMSYVDASDTAKLEETVYSIMHCLTACSQSGGEGVQIHLKFSFKVGESIPDTDSQGIVVVEQLNGEDARTEILRVPLIEGFGFQNFVRVISFKVVQVFLASGRFASYDVVTSYREGSLTLSPK